LLLLCVTLPIAVVVWPEGDDPPAGPGAEETGPLDDFDLGGLLDGQVVELDVDAMEPSVDSVTVQCVQTSDGGFLFSCDPTTAVRESTSDTGRLTVDVQVWRVINTADQGVVDCARTRCALRTFPTLVGGGLASTTLGFDPNNTGILPPEITTVQDEPTPASIITLEGNGLPDDVDVTVRGCTVNTGGVDPFACVQIFELVTRATNGTLNERINPADWDLEANACAGFCRIDFEIEGLDRMPPSIHLFTVEPSPPDASADRPDRIDVELPDSFTVAPATGLADGQDVTISVDGVELTPEIGLYLCTDPGRFECTWLEGRRIDGVAVVTIPRVWVSWRSGRQDCLTSQCSIMLLGPPFSPENAPTHEISFDPQAPLLPSVPVSVEPGAPYVDGQVVTVSYDAEAMSEVWPQISVCGAGYTDACEVVPTQGWQGGSTTVELNRRLVTPNGPFDCVDDGGCELVVWSDAPRVRFEPAPIEFDADAIPESQPTLLTVRPGSVLTDGQTIEISVRGLRPSDDPYVMICVVGATRCAGLGTFWRTSLDEHVLAHTPIRRIITTVDLEGGDLAVVDCGEVACELRLLGVRDHEPVPLEFAPGPPLPAPRLAVDIGGPLPVDELVTVQGRGFTTSGLNSGYITSIELCRADVDIAELDGCYRVGPFNQRPTSPTESGEGSFTASVIIPATPPVFAAVPEYLMCDRECALVVIPSLGEPAILPITVDRG